MNKIFFLVTVLICSFSYGQETSSIRGKILDGELFNEPLLMANVSIENTSLSTHTNFNGNFEFDHLTPGSYTIVVQFLGYETIELPVTVALGEESAVLASLKSKSLKSIGMTSDISSLK
jgi:hypothetical protein